MEIAILSDIHNNEKRLEQALEVCKKTKIKNCICCGDISTYEIIETLARFFKNVYIALGNADYALENRIETFPENVTVSKDVLDIKIDNLNLAVVHHDYKALKLAKEKNYDVIFYGHTHTPWEKTIKRTQIINPGEIAGQYGHPTFAIFETKTKKTSLKILN
jgi:hypothetical protein